MCGLIVYRPILTLQTYRQGSHANAFDVSRYAVSLSCCFRRLAADREEYGLLRAMGATCTAAKLDDIFCNSQTWESLSVLGLLR